MIVEIKGKCQYEGCEEEATDIAYNRNSVRVGVFCQKHAWIVADEGDPEYRDTCPNCGCVFGIE